MKKLIILLGLALVLTGCGSTGNNETPNPDQGTEETVLKAGTGSVTTVSSKDVTDGAGSMEVNTTYAAVVVDVDGIIQYVHFDTAQNTAAIDAEGNATAEAALTKKEKGDNYGMGAYAPNGEWYKQVESLEAYMIGKNINDVLSMEVDEAGKSVDADVLSGCTVHVNEFIEALKAAAASLTEVTGAEKALAGSYTTAAGAAGSAEFNTTFGLTLTDAEGKIVYAYFDTVQNKGTVDAEGKVTLEAADSKKVKGDNYGMGAYAPNGEWYKQIGHLESTMVGKTVADVTGVQLDDAGKSLDADVLSGCTVHISEFIEVLNNSTEKGIK